MWVEAKRLRATEMKLTPEELDAVPWSRGWLRFEGGGAFLRDTPTNAVGDVFPLLAPAAVKRINQHGIVIVGIETIMMGGVRTYRQAWWCRPLLPEGEAAMRG